MARFTDEVVFTGDVRIVGDLLTPLPRSAVLAQETLASYPVALTAARVWDAAHTNLPGTAADDDLALITGVWGTDAPTLQSSDAKVATVTQHCLVYLPLPVEYVAGQTVQISLNCGMITTASDGTATVDLAVYAIDLAGGVSADLCATAAQSINSLTSSAKDFVVTATALEPGDLLICRVTVAITDAATGTAVIGEVSAITLQCDIKG